MVLIKMSAPSFSKLSISHNLPCLNIKLMKAQGMGLALHQGSHEHPIGLTPAQNRLLRGGETGISTLSGRAAIKLYINNLAMNSMLKLFTTRML